MDKKDQNKFLNLLRNPWINLGAIGVGIALSGTGKIVTHLLAPIGQLYLAMLQMCVLPIITTAVIVSVGKLFLSGKSHQYVGRVVMVFTVGVLMTSSIGASIALIGQPGNNLPPETRKVLGKIFMESEQKEEASEEEKTGFWSLIDSIVPSNIFTAFSRGQSLAIVFFSILFGIAIGSMSSSSTGLLPLLEDIYTAFFKILNGALYGLPFGLICLIADQVSRMGMGVIIALAKLVSLFFLGCLILCIVYTITLKLSTGKKFSEVLMGLKEPLLISFVVSSSVPAIPVALESMEKNLGLSSTVSNFSVPLGVIINRQAYALLFSLSSIFVAQLYGVELGIEDIFLVIIGSAIAGMAAIGAPAVVAPMIAYVLGPMELPVAVGITIFVAISPAVDHILSMTNLYSSCASASLIGVNAKEIEKV